MNHLYQETFDIDSLYKDFSVVPPYCVGYIVRKTTVRVTYCDEPLYNQLSTARIYDIISDMRVADRSLPPCNKLVDKDTIYYQQVPINTLYEIYKPLIKSLADKTYLTTSKYFLYEDLLQDAYLVLTILYRQGYYVHGNLLKRAYINYIRKQLRKMPTHYDVVSLEQTVANKHDDDTLRLADQIEDVRATEELDSIIEDSEHDILAKRQLVVAEIGERQYNELLRAYRTHTTDASTNSKIIKLRRRLNKNDNDDND